MEITRKNLPEFDVKCIESKAKKIWKTLNEDNIEIKVTTSPMGLMLLAVGVGTAICLTRCLSKMETKKALRKQKKTLLKEAEAKAEAATAEAEA